MRNIFISTAVFYFFSVNAQTPDWAWARAVSSSNIDEVADIAGDAAGNVYLTGYFTGPSLVIGTSTLNNASPGSMQLVVAKYDRTGAAVWARSAGGSDDDQGKAIAVDGSGNVYVCGEYESSSITFGSSVLTNTSQSGQADIFLVKYSPAGSVTWARSYGGGLQEEVNDIAADGAGNIAITGNFYSLSVLFGNFGVINSGASDAYVVKVNSSGTAQWAKRVGGGMIDNGKGVGIDNSGNVYVTGDYNSNSISSFTPALSNSGGFDVFVAKYSSSGSNVFAARFGGSGDDEVSAMFTASGGDFYVAGNFESSSIQVGTVSLSNTAGRSLFVAGYNAAGSVQWAKRSTASQNTEPTGLVAGSSSLFMTGFFDIASLSFGSTSVSNGGSLDAFIVSFATSNGNTQWARASGSAGLDQSNAVVLAGGNVHLGGLFTSTLSLRDNELTASGQADGFIVKLCVPPATPVSASGATVCAGLPMVLTANVPPGTNAVWFTSATGGSPVATGNLNTSSPGTFYVAAKDTNAGCAMYSAGRIAAGAAHHPPVNASVAVSGHTLSALGNGSVVAWYNCVSASTITGQKANTYVLNASGHYAVIMVSQQGCRDTSACNHYSYTPGSDTTIVTVGLRESGGQLSLTAYPNPSSGVFVVRGNHRMECRLVNALGATVEEFTLDAVNHYRRSLGPLPPGIYFVTAGRSTATRVIVTE